MLGKLLRPNRRFFVALFGMAAALALPLVSMGVVEQLNTAEPSGQVGPGDDIRILYGDPTYAAFSDSPVEPGFGLLMPDARPGPAPDGSPLQLRGSPLLPLAPVDAIIVHPSQLEGGVGLSQTGQPFGARAFAAASNAHVQDTSLVLLLATLPAVGLIAFLFAEQEAAERAGTSATIRVLGHRKFAIWILSLRVGLAYLGAWLVAGTLATLLGGSWMVWLVGLAIAVAAWLLSIWRISIRVGREAYFRSREDPGKRLGFLPVSARPLILGTRLIPVFIVAALVFAVDVGVPLASSQVPGALAGKNEALVGEPLVLGGRVDLSRAIIADHPDVDRAVAEVVFATVVEDAPVLVRGADWLDWQAYHGVHLVGSADGVVLGSALAQRLNKGIDDSLFVAGARAYGREEVVTGIMRGNALLEDELWLPLQVAQDLAGLGSDEVTVVRAAPANRAVLDALGSSAALMEVTQLELVPPAPAVGSLAAARIHTSNLGAQTGERVLELRVNDQFVGSAVATLGPHRRGTVDIPFLVPEGPFRLAVNPEAEFQAGEASRTLRLGSNQVQVLEGAPVSDATVTVHASLADAWAGNALAEARTDASGWASFSLDVGVYVVRSGTAAAQWVVANDEPFYVVEDVHVTSDLVPGQRGEITITFRNLGTGYDALPVFLDDRMLGDLDLPLASGQAGSEVFRFTARQGTQNLTAGTLQVPIVVEAVDPKSAYAPIAGADVRQSESVRADLGEQALGSARRVLSGLATVAAVATLSLVVLATERVVEGRKPIRDALAKVGMSHESIRRRAVTEAAILAALSFALAALVAWMLFTLSARVSWPMAYGHRLPAPSLLMVTQAAAAFVAAAAWTTRHATIAPRLK